MRGTPHASRVPALILAGIAILNLARGAFHWLAPDSGAGSVAGMNLSYPPVSPVPGRFAHVTTLALSVSGLAIAAVVSRRNRRG